MKKILAGTLFIVAFIYFSFIITYQMGEASGAKKGYAKGYKMGYEYGSRLVNYVNFDGGVAVFDHTLNDSEIVAVRDSMYTKHYKGK